jgi:hypothetical protein
VVLYDGYNPVFPVLLFNPLEYPSQWLPAMPIKDDIFYFGGQNAHNELVVERHIASINMEIDLEPGDLIGFFNIRQLHGYQAEFLIGTKKNLVRRS